MYDHPQLESSINCAGSAKFLAMQFGVKSMPGIIMLVAGTIRSCQIWHMAKASVVYSRLFKAKFAISFMMSIVSFLYMIVVFATPKNSNVSSWINQCDKQGYSLIYLIQTAAWAFGTFLMIFEYQRKLPEARYVNQLFWWLNLIAETLTVIVLWQQIKSSGFMIFTAVFNLTINLLLIILVCKTTRYPGRRPQDFGAPLIPELAFVYQDESQQDFKIKFQEKAIWLKDQNYFQFRVEFADKNQVAVKVQKLKQDFEKLEQIVLESIRKQSLFFNDGTFNSVGRDPIPKLEDPNELSRSFLSSISTVSNEQASENRMLSTIRNLERFCNEITANKLLWTPEVLIFFQVPKELLAKFEQERERYQRKRQLELDGSRCRDSGNGRRGSYADLESYQKASNEYLGNQDSSNAPFFDSNSSSVLKRGVYPLSVRFLKFQESTVGNYIEFKIRVRFQEGPQEKRATNSIDPNEPSDIFEWDIYKRYSGFTSLNDQILPYIRAMGLRAPELPGPITKIGGLNKNLSARMQQLEKYLCDLIVILSDRYPVPLLTFLNLHEQSQIEFTQVDTLQQLSEINLKSAEVVIPENKIIVNNEGSAKMNFTVTLSYTQFPQPDSDGTTNQSKDSVPQLAFDESVIPQVSLTVLKTYGDFKRLDYFLSSSDLQPESGVKLPQLPQKLNKSNFKKSADQIQAELQQWFQQILRITVATRMFTLKYFFLVSQSPTSSMDSLLGNENRFSYSVGSLKIARPGQMNQLVGVKLKQKSITMTSDDEFKGNLLENSGPIQFENSQYTNEANQLANSSNQSTHKVEIDDEDPFAFN